MDDLHALARQWLADYDAGAPGRLFEEPRALTIPRAYELQGEIARLREARGERVIGYKVGCISPVIQEQLGVAEPVFGRLYDSGCVPSGASISAARNPGLAIEGEIAVRISEDLPGAIFDDQDSVRFIASVFPVVELHHYQLHGTSSPATELITGSGMNAGFVLPEVEAPRTASIEHTQHLTIRIDDDEVDAYDDPDAIGSAARSVRWLSAKLAEFGIRLARGQIVLTGSPMRLHRVAPGKNIVVRTASLGQSCARIGP
jgi:2-keto-4-pentenoate hydratase